MTGGSACAQACPRARAGTSPPGTSRSSATVPSAGGSAASSRARTRSSPRASRSTTSSGKVLWKIDSGEKTAAQSEKLVFWYAIVATLLAVIGLEMLPFGDSITVSHILGVVALIWVLAATFFLLQGDEVHRCTARPSSTRRSILIFAIVAVVIAVNAVAWLVHAT